MTQSAKRRSTFGASLKRMDDEIYDIYALKRRLSSPQAIQSAINGGAPASSTEGGSNDNYVRTAGDTMIGPLAFYRALISIDGAGDIDISEGTDNFRGRIIVAPASGSTDDLVSITGAKYSGQLLFLQGILTNTITIKTTGNIDTIGGTDFVWSDNKILIFMFDDIQNKWKQLTTGAGTSGSTGVTESQSPVTWTGIHTFNGSSTSINSGSIFLGDSTADDLFITARIRSNMIPDADVTYDMGSASLRWSSIYGAIIISSTGSFSSSLASNGSTFLGSAITNTITVTGRFNSSLLPITDDLYDLGSSTREWRDLYIDGTANIDTLSVGVINATGAVGLAGASTSITSGAIFLGDSTADNLSILAQINSDIIPDANDTYDLGSSSLGWQNIWNSNLLAIFENFASGFAPSSVTGYALLFCRDDGAGKTELRVKFQTGTSVLIATEP